MAEHRPLINRAIAMHLLREGQFSVASTFLREIGEPQGTSAFETNPEPPASHLDSDGDDDMDAEHCCAIALRLAVSSGGDEELEGEAGLVRM